MKRACLYSGGIDSATAHYIYGGDKYTVEWEGYRTEDDGAGQPILITKKMVVDAVDAIFKCFDRPIVETGIFPLYFAYKFLSKKGYKEIVTGDGADELFLGYKWDKLAWLGKRVVEHEIINHLFGHHVYIANTLAKHFKVTVLSPFLLPEVIEFVYKLPLSYKCTLFRDKILLRDLMKGVVPLRPKYYFHNPIQQWLGITRKDKARWFLKRWLESR